MDDNTTSEIKRLYLVENLSKSEIMSKLNLGYKILQRNMQHHNIIKSKELMYKNRNIEKRKDIDIEKLKELFYSGLSQQKIANRFKCSSSVIAHRINELKLQRKYLKNSKKVKQILNKKVINTYSSIKEATEKTGICRGAIGRSCNNGKNSAGGYMWEFT